MRAMSALSECMQKAAAGMEAKTSRIVGPMAQQLEKELEAAMASTAVTSEHTTRLVAEGLREEI